MPEEKDASVEHSDEVSKEAQAFAQSDGKSMHIKVYAPFKTYFDGEATSISAVNETGPFDILPKHHNFMTLLSAGDIVVRSEQGEDKIKITRGIMHVKADEVVVFLDV